MESVLIAASFVLSLLLILSFIFRKNRKRKAQEGQPETAENERTIEKDKQKKFRRAGFFALIIVVTVGLWNELTSVDKQIVRCNLTGNNEFALFKQSSTNCSVGSYIRLLLSSKEDFSLIYPSATACLRTWRRFILEAYFFGTSEIAYYHNI